jgi:VIT1/CCC1 family predicted Fe2+/Mn2+ transporter
MEELSDLLGVIGIHEDQTDLRREISNYYENRPEALLKVMVALEFGVVDAGARSAWAAGALSGFLFLLGSLPSVLPFLARKNSSPLTGLIVSAVATSLSLLLVGAIKTWATRGNCASAAIENLVIAGCGGASAYGLGILFGIILK